MSSLGAMPGWSPSRDLEAHLNEESERTLRAYAAQPTLVREHVGIEANIFASGYGQRQVFELIQNAADAILTGGTPGRVRVVLTHDALYCANEGAPVGKEGITAILSAHLSAKRGDQIGHFGLGFKSVLAVTSAPQFFSRSISFGFDREASRTQIRAILPFVDEVPILRIGHLLDPVIESTRDDTLRELMTWATTVVRLPRNVGDSSWLPGELTGFPSAFFVFSPQVSGLELCDNVAGTKRLIQATVQGNRVRILEAGDESVWRVFRRPLPVTVLTPVERADAEATTLQREDLPLIWAVRTDTSRGRGRFWAFFPTETETTLTGVLNAPWKTNADRQNLLDGPFNRRLLKEFVLMVAAAWPRLVEPAEPGAVLDLLPVRDQDAKNWADRLLGEGLYRELSNRDCLPDCKGAFGRPSEIALRPDLATSDGGRDWLSKWPQGDCEGRRRWAHVSVETRDRRPRAERLGAGRGALRGWLEDIATGDTVQASMRAIALVDAVWPGMNPEAVAEAKTTRFVRTTTGLLAAPDRALCLPVDNVASPPGIALVARELADDTATRDTLARKLGVQPIGVDVQVDIEVSLPQPNWQRVWSLLRQLPIENARLLARRLAPTLRARTLAGSFAPLSHLLLPGPVADPDVMDDRALIVDLQWHQPDRALLEAAGVVDGPVKGKKPEGGWYEAYLKAARSAYRQMESRAAMDVDILPTDEWPVPGPLHPFIHGSRELRKKYTARVLPLLAGELAWVFHCKSKPKARQTVLFLSPVRWCVKSFGILETSLGPAETKAAVSPDLSRWDVVLPVADVTSEEAHRLSMAADLATLSQAQWGSAFQTASNLESLEDLEVAWAFYAEACQHRQAPAAIVAFANAKPVDVPPFRVKVTDDRDRFDALQDSGIKAILVPDARAVEALVASWKLSEVSAAMSAEPSGPAEPLLDVFPALAPFLAKSGHDSLLLQPCSRVWLELVEGGAASRRDVPFARVGSSFCYADGLDRRALLDKIVAELGLDLRPQHVFGILNPADEAQRRGAWERVRACSTPAAKLLAAIGEQAIRRQLPAKVVVAAIERAGSRPVDIVLAEAAVAVFGVELLKRYRHELVAAGFVAPSQWTGGASALEFCERLGFPREFAGFEPIRRDPSLDVDGPVEWKPLHSEYQQPIVERIRAFFAKTAPDRGLLSLPTGAGKTRVVVEALIGAMRDRADSALLIWIAQSDELCEQAVVAWAQAWRAVGRSERLRVSRLWGTTNNRVRPVDDAPHVVVATYQSLGSRLQRPDYAWLKTVKCLIVDEAHGSTAPSYTKILEEVGITARETAIHLVGLTATPFRGSGADEAETRWLANRYGQSRFDHGVFPEDDPYPYLQGLGVLARVEQDVLEGGDVSLSTLEMVHLAQYQVLPPDAERRLGEDDIRNSTLLDAIALLDPTWPVLFFATSVEHSELMAALLSMRGITAKPISGMTEAGARRHYIREFKAGRIRVLTNYGVLTTGFDAPSVRALVIARPVYSRGLYQQMIGRGLRGPRNGGKESCLIVNVADNVAQFGGQLAFRHFEHLWKPWPGVQAQAAQPSGD